MSPKGGGHSSVLPAISVVEMGAHAHLTSSALLY